MQTSRVSRSQGILVAAQLARLGLFVVTTSVLGRWLTPADFGFVALVSTLFLVSQEVLDMGTSAVVTRRVAQHPGEERQALQALLSWRRLAALGLSAIALSLAFFGMGADSGQRLVLVLAALALSLLCLNAYHVVFQTRQAFGKAVSLGLGAQIVFLLSGVVVLRGGSGGSFAGMAGGSVMGLLVVVRELLQVFASRTVAVALLGAKLRAAWLDPGIGVLLRRSGAFGAAALSYKLSALSAPLLVWIWSTPQALGQFNAAHRLLGPFTDTAWLFATPLIAAMSVHTRTRPSALRLQLRSLVQLMLALACIVAVSAQWVAPRVLKLLYGSTYGEGEFSSVGILRWLGVAGAFAIVTPLLAVACLAQHRERFLLLVSTSGLVLSLAGHCVLIPQAGPQGAAMVLSAAEAWVMLALLTGAVRRGDLRLGVDWLVFVAPAALLAAVLPWLAAWPAAQLTLCVVAVPLSLVALRGLPGQRAARAALALPTAAAASNGAAA